MQITREQLGFYAHFQYGDLCGGFGKNIPIIILIVMSKISLSPADSDVIYGLWQPHNQQQPLSHWIYGSRAINPIWLK